MSLSYCKLISPSYHGYISMKEDYLPHHMRIGFVNRIIRFIFGPMCIVAIFSLINYYKEYKEIDDLCFRRNECYSNCVNDNFPNLTCEKEKLNLTYNGNVYDSFYFYPKTNTSKYQECLSYVNSND